MAARVWKGLLFACRMFIMLKVGVLGITVTCQRLVVAFECAIYVVVSPYCPGVSALWRSSCRVPTPLTYNGKWHLPSIFFLPNIAWEGQGSFCGWNHVIVANKKHCSSMYNPLPLWHKHVISNSKSTFLFPHNFHSSYEGQFTQGSKSCSCQQVPTWRQSPNFWALRNH